MASVSPQMLVCPKPSSKAKVTLTENLKELIFLPSIRTLEDLMQNPSEVSLLSLVIACKSPSAVSHT